MLEHQEADSQGELETKLIKVRPQSRNQSLRSLRSPTWIKGSGELLSDWLMGSSRPSSHF